MRLFRSFLTLTTLLAAGATLPATAAVEVGLGPPPEEHHVITWDAHDALPGGRKGELFGYDIHYAGAKPTGGDNATRLVAGASADDGSARFTWTDSDEGYATRCHADRYWVIGYTRGRKAYTEPEQGSTVDGAVLCDGGGGGGDGGGGGGGGGGGPVQIATTAPAQVMDESVTTPTCAAAVDAAVSTPLGYQIDWAEEFDFGGEAGTIEKLIATGYWTAQQPWGADVIVNGESQYYVDPTDPTSTETWNPFDFVTESGSSMTDGKYLVIQAAPYVSGVDGSGAPILASRENPTAKHASGVLTTFTDKGKIEPPVYVEVRAKMPRGRGAFPAIWALDANLTGGDQELDIVEYIAQSNVNLSSTAPDTAGWIAPPLFGSSTWETMYHTYHDQRGSSVSTYTNSNEGETPEWCGESVDFTREFHTFGLEYTAGAVVWSIDGVEVQRIVPRRGGTGDGTTVRNFPNAEMYLVLNLAFDLSWFDKSGVDCCVSDDTTLAHFFNPAGNDVNLAVDYVRVYKPAP